MTARCPVRTPVECALAMGHDPPCSPRIEDEFPASVLTPGWATCPWVLVIDESVNFCAAALGHETEHAFHRSDTTLAERLAALDLVGTFAVSTIEEDE
jgi:hypothetical protein